jgi:GT2 family glycosyltransferase
MTSAVILNYQTADLTTAAVGALRASTVQPAEVIVVDNASGDGSVERLRSLPRTTLVTARTNGGFSAGCNLGIRHALSRGARRVLLLNSDTTVSADMLHKLESAMDRDRSVGIAGPILMSRQRPDRVESTGIRYRPTFGRFYHEDYGRLVGEASAGTKPVDAIAGCAMLISRDVFDQAGLFADEFFFGFEDIDLCLRAKQAGFTTFCVGGAIAWHEGNASIGRHSSSRAYFGARNQLLLASRATGSRSWARTASVIALNAAHALRQPDIPRLQALAAVGRGTADYFRGRYGPDPKA